MLLLLTSYNSLHCFFFFLFSIHIIRFPELWPFVLFQVFLFYFPMYVCMCVCFLLLDMCLFHGENTYESYGTIIIQYCVTIWPNNNKKTFNSMLFSTRSTYSVIYIYIFLDMYIFCAFLFYIRSFYINMNENL